MSPYPRSEQLVLDVLGDASHALALAELTAASGLSAPTVRGVLESLAGIGAVVEAPARAPRGRGRPPVRYTLASRTGVVIGIDAGHRHLRGAVASMAGDVLEGPLDARDKVVANGPAVFAQVADLIEGLLRGRPATEVRAVAMGLPAPIKDGRVARRTYLPGLTGLDLASELDDQISRHPALAGFAAPVVVENDANLGALGEGRYGEAQGRSNFLYIKASSGIGMGLVLDGQVYRGGRGLAGELGHVRVPPATETLLGENTVERVPRGTCTRCGQNNCLQNLASCDAIIAQLGILFRGRRGRPRTIETVIRNADSVTEFAQVISNAGQRIGASLVDLMHLLDPELVVVGGKLAGAGDALIDAMTVGAKRGTKGFGDIPISLVAPDRIKRSEVDGAIVCALNAARAVAA